MTDLSPAAQAVLDAANNSSAYGPEDCLNEARQIAAAALRAVADRAIPVTKFPWGSTLIPVLDAMESRKRILSIADELEALPE